MMKKSSFRQRRIFDLRQIALMLALILLPSTSLFAQSGTTHTSYWLGASGSCGSIYSGAYAQDCSGTLAANTPYETLDPGFSLPGPDLVVDLHGGTWDIHRSSGLVRVASGPDGFPATAADLVTISIPGGANSIYFGVRLVGGGLSTIGHAAVRLKKDGVVVQDWTSDSTQPSSNLFPRHDQPRSSNPWPNNNQDPFVATLSGVDFDEIELSASGNTVLEMGKNGSQFWLGGVDPNAVSGGSGPAPEAPVRYAVNYAGDCADLTNGITKPGYNYGACNPGNGPLPVWSGSANPGPEITFTAANNDCSIESHPSSGVAYVTRGNDIAPQYGKKITSKSVVTLPTTSRHFVAWPAAYGTGDATVRLLRDGAVLKSWSLNNGANTLSTDDYVFDTVEFETTASRTIGLGNLILLEFDFGDGEATNLVAPTCDPVVDSDGDGVPDDQDAFPTDPTETADTDGDGVGDNGDAFPEDASETTDSDNDGVGDNSDVFPGDPNESSDSDGDGVGDNGDAFPNDALESSDQDGDGVGDNADPDDDGNGLPDLSEGVVFALQALSTNGDCVQDPSGGKSGKSGKSSKKSDKSSKSDKSDKSGKSSKNDHASDLEKAIASVQASLNPNYWVDATHLDAKKGSKVFKDAKKAVGALEDFIKDTEGCDDVAELAIANLIEINLMLVNTALSEVECNGKRKCDREMDKARKALAKADNYLTKGKPANAINEYGKAWSFAQKAGKYAPSSRMETEFVLGTKQMDALTLGIEVPVEFGLTGNYPNPFNPETTIGFEMPESAQVTLAVYDLLGRRVAMLVNGVLDAGKHTARFDATELPSGGYIYRLTTPAGEFTKMMMLMK